MNETASKIEILATEIVLSQTTNAVVISAGRLETYGREYSNSIKFFSIHLMTIGDIVIVYLTTQVLLQLFTF